MKNNSHYILRLFAMVLLFSCQPQNNEKIPIIDLDNNLGKVDQKLSDLAGKLQAIPLETNDNCLLPNYFEIWVGENNIITIARDAIHLFHINGQHIKKLAQEGRGPGEYEQVRVWTVDESKNKLYYTDPTDKENIRSIELQTGNIDKIPISTPVPDIMVIDNDHSLVYCPLPQLGETYDIYYITESGNLSYNVPIDSSLWRKDKIKKLSSSYLCKTSTGITYSIPTSDTIYHINRRIKEPLAIIKLKNLLDLDKKQGVTYSIKMEGLQELFLYVQEMKIVTDESMFVFFPTKKEKSIYRINKKDGIVHKIDRFYLDIFDTYTNFPIGNKTSNNKIFYKINALEIISMAEKKKEAGEELTPRLKELSEQLKEEDNPVIIVGELK